MRAVVVIMAVVVVVVVVVVDSVTCIKSNVWPIGGSGGGRLVALLNRFVLASSLLSGLQIED